MPSYQYSLTTGMLVNMCIYMWLLFKYTGLLLLLNTANITPKKPIKTLSCSYLFIDNKVHAFHGHLMTDPALLETLHQSLSR